MAARQSLPAGLSRSVKLLVQKREGVKQQRHGEAETFKPSPLRGEEIASAEHGLAVGSGYRGMECQQIDCAGCGNAEEADRPCGACVAEIDEDEEQDEGGRVNEHERMHKSGEKQEERAESPAVVHSGSESEEP